MSRASLAPQAAWLSGLQALLPCIGALEAATNSVTKDMLRSGGVTCTAGLDASSFSFSPLQGVAFTLGIDDLVALHPSATSLAKKSKPNWNQELNKFKIEDYGMYVCVCVYLSPVWSLFNCVLSLYVCVHCDPCLELLGVYGCVCVCVVILLPHSVCLLRTELTTQQVNKLPKINNSTTKLTN